MGAITLTTNFVYLFFLFWLASTIRWRVDYSKLALTWHHTQTISISALGSLFFSLFFFIRVSYTCDIPNFKWGEIFFFLSLCVCWLYMASVIFWYELWGPSLQQRSYIQVVWSLYFQKWPNKGKRRKNKERKRNKRRGKWEMGPNGGGGGDLSRTGISTMGSADFAGISKVETLKFFLLTLKDLIGNSLAVNLPSFFFFFFWFFFFFLLHICFFVPPPSTCPFISNSTWKYRNKFPVAYCTSTDGAHFARILPIYFCPSLSFVLWWRGGHLDSKRAMECAVPTYTHIH